MIPLLKSIITKRDNNTMEIGLLFLSLLKVEATRNFFRQSIEEHPTPNTLLCLSDVINDYGISTVTLKPTINQLKTCPLPAIVQMKSEKNSFFSILRSIDDISIQYFNPYSLKWIDRPIDSFIEDWSGVIMLGERNEITGEKDYLSHIQLERAKKNKVFLSSILISVFILLSLLLAFKSNTILWSAIFFFLLSMAGLFIGILLIWHEVDAYNPFIKKICSGANKKINCNAILGSSASKIVFFSWSEIGFSYFLSIFILSIFNGISGNDNIFLFGWISTIAVPYTIFSFYYQWRVAKQWCKLCIATQVILLLQFITVTYEGWIKGSLPGSQYFVATFFVFTFSLLGIHFLIPILKKGKLNETSQKAYNRLKHDVRIFSSLLEKQKKVTNPTNGLGITIGSKNPTTKIIKVCNPYCGPCAAAHPDIEAILDRNEDVQVQIIFTATNRDGDIKAEPVKHLLAIDENGDDDKVRKALDDWYLASKKDYSVFANRYPMNGELSRQTKKIEVMEKWCKKTGITFTPTFFINGYQMPDIYNLSDLKYFLS